MTSPTASPGPRLVLLGAGGHARVLLELIRRLGGMVVGVLDDDPNKQGQSFQGIPILGSDPLENMPPSGVGLVNAVGSVRQPVQRQQMFNRFAERGYRFVTLTHPSATIAGDAQLAEGSQVMAGAVVQNGARVGRDTIINTCSVIEHDTVVGEHCHVAPGVTVCGEVTIGDGSHLGAGATIVQGRQVGSGCLVGAGAVILKDLPDRCSAWGVPATIQPNHDDEDES